MTIQTTRWTPDTCSNPPCIVDFTWDDSVPSDQRVQTFSNIIQKCSDHSALSGIEVYNTILEENPRKNKTLAECLANGPVALFNTDANGARTLKPNLKFNFSWSGVVPNRVLTVSFTGITLTTTQKNTIQTFLDNRFGIGKVNLV